VDCVAAKLMGFDYSKIPSLRNAFRIKQFPLTNLNYDDIKIVSRSIPQYNHVLKDIPKAECFCFKPHFGWTGNIEL